MKLFRFLLLLGIISSAITIYANPVRPGKIKRLFKRSEVLGRHHVGFALYDLGTGKMIYGQQEDKYFTPASNTKLFTFYAGLKMLKDSIPGLQYIERGDSLIFWGTGDPSLLHPDLSEQPVLEKLRAAGRKLYYSAGRYTGDIYGTGWAYDDYNEYYQPEMSEMPVSGNVIRFRNQNGTLASKPAAGYFEIRTDSLRQGKFVIRRELFLNIFNTPMVPMPAGYSQEVPFRYSAELAMRILSDTLKKEIRIARYPWPVQGAKTWYSIPRDSLFKRMLLPSDNLMAEQLLLTYAAENGLEMNARKVIEHVQENYLTSLPDKPQWVDGSGLSRQNLFTPRTMIKLCELIYQEFSGREAELFELLPQGGKTGTIRNYFKSGQPFVFAKTGSLSNNVNLSGYLVTRKGKRLAFSFMNNNYTQPTVEIRKEMDRILTAVHTAY
jgi:serine-type D-Ala-D-Ala carboxypeptidase/endopeptidase (penicillin-binding protein 4)